MKTISLRNAVLCFALSAVTTVSAQIAIDTVPVGNPGNSNDWSTGNLYGGVAYTYRIGTYDVTDAQYRAFLNAVDPTGANSLGLFRSNMRIGLNPASPNGSKYLGSSNRPVQWVSIYDVKRFANWLHNGQGSGDTETGAYNLSAGGLAPRNADAKVFIPSESEWYKAAYYDPTIPEALKYWIYGTRSNIAPYASAPTSEPNRANYNEVVQGVTDVGAYTGSASYYGAYDMAGNVYQYTEGVFSGGPIARGGWYHDSASAMQSSYRHAIFPLDYEYLAVGFRVASFAPIGAVPEPSASLLACLGIALLASRRRRKTL